MKRKAHPVTNFGGLDVSKDPMYLEDTESPNISLVRYHKGMLKKDFGYSSFSSVPERVMLLTNFRLRTGVTHNLLHSVDHSYKYESGSWVKISTDPGAVWTGDEDDMFWDCVFDDKYIVTNYKDAAQIWDGTNWATLGGLGATRFRYCLPFYDHLVLGYVYDTNVYPMRIQWSKISDPETYDLSWFFDLDDSVGPIQGLCTFADSLYVFKQDSIWEVYHIGGTDVYKARLTKGGLGCYSGNTIKSSPHGIFFLGTDNIYLFTGSEFKPIGDKVYNLIFPQETRIVNTERFNRSHAIYSSGTNEYIIVFPTVSSFGEPELVLKYDILRKEWSRRTTACTALGLYTASGSAILWKDAVGKWADPAWDIPWGQDVLYSGIPTVLYGKSDGTVIRDDKISTTTDQMVWESKDEIYGHATRITECRFFCKGGPFQVGYSFDGGLTWSVDVTLTPDTVEFKEVVDFLNVTTVKARIRIRSTSTVFEMQWFEFWGIDRVRSKRDN